MRALIVFESLYGNTRFVAEQVAEGLEPGYQVTVAPVDAADPTLVAQADLLVVGAPTHVHGLSRRSTRSAGARDRRVLSGALPVEPHSGGPGVREWLDELGHGAGRPAAAFDTRMAGPPLLTGRASRRIARSLRRHHFALVHGPVSFTVTRDNELAPHEAAAAQAWGHELARRTPACTGTDRASTEDSDASR